MEVNENTHTLEKGNISSEFVAQYLTRHALSKNRAMKNL
jgi:hypothetical protein